MPAMKDVSNGRIFETKNSRPLSLFSSSPRLIHAFSNQKPSRSLSFLLLPRLIHAQGLSFALIIELSDLKQERYSDSAKRGFLDSNQSPIRHFSTLTSPQFCPLFFLLKSAKRASFCLHLWIVRFKARYIFRFSEKGFCFLRFSVFCDTRSLDFLVLCVSVWSSAYSSSGLWDFSSSGECLILPLSIERHTWVEESWKSSSFPIKSHGGSRMRRGRKGWWKKLRSCLSFVD